jgi:hypothetical protein
VLALLAERRITRAAPQEILLENPPDDAGGRESAGSFVSEFLASDSRHAASSSQSGRSNRLQRTHGMVA